MAPQLVPPATSLDSRAPPRHTIAAPLAVAAATTFDAIELLEQILFQLEPAELIIAHQVCKTWRTVVKTSIHLRRSAFPWIEPIPTTEFLIWEYVQDPKSAGNSRYALQSRISSEHAPGALRIIRHNPTFSSMNSVMCQRGTPMEMDTKKMLSWEPNDFWRGQLLCQPPVAVKKLEVLNWEGSLRKALSACSGVTLGDLHDVLKEYFIGSGLVVRTVRFRMSGFLSEDSIWVKQAREDRALEEAERMKVQTVKEVEAEEDRQAVEDFVKVLGRD